MDLSKVVKDHQLVEVELDMVEMVVAQVVEQVEDLLMVTTWS